MYGAIFKLILIVVGAMVVVEIISAMWSGGPFVNPITALLDMVTCIPCWVINLIASILEGVLEAVVAIVDNLLTGNTTPPAGGYINISPPCTSPTC